MAKFCEHCGAKQDDINSKFCSSCGKPLEELSNLKSSKDENKSNNLKPGEMFCPFCKKVIPYNINDCPYCGGEINPKNHTASIVIGYICCFIPILHLVAFILGIYLITRKNKKVHKHGIIMIILTLLFVFLTFFFISYINYYY